MSLDEIKKYLSYDPETGVFTWIAKPKGRGYPFKVGDEAGCTAPDGRRIVCFDGTNYLASRLAWFFVYGEMPPDGVEVEHRNVDHGDNRISNLRLANRFQNMMNARGHKDARSKYKGVCWHAQRGKWHARLQGKSLGLFDDEEDAARAYDVAALAASPEYARLNFPKGTQPCPVS